MNRPRLLVGRRGRARLLLTAILAVLPWSLIALWHQRSQAELEGPSPVDRQVVLWVSRLMEGQHLSRRFLDDEISQRTLDTFLKSLDPMKVYFYQLDIDQFKAYENQIDDMVKKGDIGLAHRVFQRFLQRVDERTGMVDRLLLQQHDFQSDEDIIIDRDALAYPKDEAEALERWRKRVKYELLRQKADDVEPEKAIEKVRRRYHSIAKQWHQTDDDELLQMYLSAMTLSFDPHSSYMSANTLENFEISMKLELDGIGASLRYIDGYTVVHKIIPGGAADKDGQLKPEDKIVAVGEGTDGEMVDVVDTKLRDVVKMIRGPRGTVVRLGVMPAGQEGQQQVYAITRARIELKDSEARSEIIDVGSKADGLPLRVGVIDLPSFYMDMSGARQHPEKDYKSTTRDVRRLLDGFRDKHVDAVVMDLRGNGGGSLTEAINLTGLFIDVGPIVQVKWPDGRILPHPDNDPGMAWSGPLVVLIDKFSASASEIFAGAIQDYGRGIIVGDNSTHGKGTVQQLFDLGKALFRRSDAPNYGALKMTIQQFYRPSGDSTQNRGVVADIELPSLTTHLDVGEADLDYALAFDRVPSTAHAQYQLTSPVMLEYLRNHSVQRTGESEDFQKELKKIERYQERKLRKKVTLNEERFLAERAEFDEEKEEEKQLEELADTDRDVVKRDYYFNEALAITRDYVDQLQKLKVAGTATQPIAVP